MRSRRHSSPVIITPMFHSGVKEISCNGRKGSKCDIMLDVMKQARQATTNEHVLQELQEFHTRSEGSCSLRIEETSNNGIVEDDTISEGSLGERAIDFAGNVLRRSSYPSINYMSGNPLLNTIDRYGNFVAK
mmetsp:Transcript_15217/g.51304  ORF Transcript_15217/g.51304 Transcript_15217/m.51304 type:complete len:132 (-) Transcript_15217:48-443(-)